MKKVILDGISISRAGVQEVGPEGKPVFLPHPKYCQQYFKVFPRSSRSTNTASLNLEKIVIWEASYFASKGQT